MKWQAAFAGALVSAVVSFLASSIAAPSIASAEIRIVDDPGGEVFSYIRKFESVRASGDHVVIVNAAKVKLTGRKEEQKIYRRHSGYEGGLREERAKIVRQRRPVRIMEEAVHGMLPKTTMGSAMYRKLKVYAGPEHPHVAQKPSTREVA